VRTLFRLKAEIAPEISTVNLDRRTARRYDLSFPVRIFTPGKAVQNSPSGSTRDISARGVYLVLPQDLPIGQRFNFLMTLSAEIADLRKVSVRIRGRVIRVDTCPGDQSGRFGIAALIEWYDIFRGDPVASRPKSDE
jgi:hypothetical protein